MAVKGKRAEFFGKTVMITGCSRGIGLKMLELFYAEGANVLAHARKQTDEFEEKMRAIAENQEGENWIKAVYFDLEKEEEIKAAIKGLISEKSEIDILVNNAGITSRNTLHMLTMEQLKKVYAVNFFSQVYITQLVSRYMIRKRAGSIIHISSVSGLDHAEGTLAYGGSKASLAWSTKTLAMELGKYGIRVNTIAPGLIDTDMLAYKTEEQKRQLIAGNCIQRMGTAEDVANAAIFLASDRASYITGQIIRVDGGRV